MRMRDKSSHFGTKILEENTMISFIWKPEFKNIYDPNLANLYKMWMDIRMGFNDKLQAFTLHSRIKINYAPPSPAFDSSDHI